MLSQTPARPRRVCVTVPAADRKGSGGELRCAWRKIAAVHPEPFEAPQGDDHRFELSLSKRGLLQHLEVPLVHRAEPVADASPLLGQRDVSGAAGVWGTLLCQIS